MGVLRNIFVLCVALFVLSACERDYDDKQLMSQVTIILELPDSDNDGTSDVVESILPMESSFISEYNTRENYSFGIFNGNRTMVELQKGVYTLMLDATIYLPNGDVRMARCAEYAQPNTAVKILEDCEEIRLKMSYIY